jgi:gliding motility-associated-like protein
VGDFYYFVTVGTPVVGCNSVDSFMLHVLPDDFTLISQDTGICFPPNAYQVRALGDTEFMYHWVPNYNVSDPYSLTPIISPDATTRYTITATYPGCPDMVHSVEYSIQHPQVNIQTGDTTVCIETPMPLRVAVTPPDSPYTFTWTPTAGLVDGTVIEPSFFSGPGTYNYTVVIVSGLGCSDSDHIAIVSAPPVHIVATPGPTTIKYGEQVQLNAISLTPDPLYYFWTPDDGSLTDNNINNPVARPTDSTNYIVYGMNEWGCRDTAEIAITVDQTMSECLPSAFTPNGDGKNDVFRLLCNKYQKLVDFRVFNRWGQVVYENTNDPSKGWDGSFNGQPQDMGVYFYSITVARPGKLNISYKGEVTLIR